MFGEFQRAAVAPFKEGEDVWEILGRFQVALTSMGMFLTLFHVLKYIVYPRVSSTFLSLGKVDQFRWCEKTLSITHATMATVGAIASTYATIQTFSDGLNSQQNYDEVLAGAPQPLHRDMWIQISIGYFLSDLVLYCIPPFHHTVPEYLHHVVAACSYGLGVYFQWGTWIQINFLINELSTPFLQFTWFFRFMNLRHTPIDKASRVAFALLFFISRIVWNTVFCWWVFRAVQTVVIPPRVIPYVFWIQVVLISAHCSLQYFWFYKIVQIFVAGKAEDKVMGVDETKAEAAAKIKNQ